MYKIMTPGPTKVRENVRMARSLETTNPDMDLDFVEYYKDTCDKIGGFLGTKGNVYILSGEGILGLEAACASLTEAGDRVLVIDNGVYGKYFSDFVKIYGGEVVYFTSSYNKPIDINELRVFLKKDSNFKYATVVHCDTPSGVLNDVGSICPLLHEFGILSVVDSVSASFGEKLEIDKSCIDIFCGGSQKALSAPPGLTILAVSRAAMDNMEERKTAIASFYCNILTFKNYYTDKWFPYTMPISDIVGLRRAVINVCEDKNIFDRHRRIAEAVRKSVIKSGLELFLEDGYSNTVTVVSVPKGTSESEILKTMTEKYKIMLGGGIDVLAGKVIRIGHMGENANEKDVEETMAALENTFADLGITLKYSLRKGFLEAL